MSTLRGEKVDQQPYYKAMGEIMDALQYPVAKDGTILGISDALNWMKPVIAWHLSRCGMGLVNEPLIKKQRVDNPLIEDAVKWVPADAPDDPLENVEDMTINQINALPEDLRVAAKRRLGLLPTPEPTPGWEQPPVVNIDDEQEDSDA